MKKSQVERIERVVTFCQWVERCRQSKRTLSEEDIDHMAAECGLAPPRLAGSTGGTASAYIA